MKWTIIAAFLVSTLALGEEVDAPATELPDKPEMNTLGKVDAEVSPDATSINIRFSDALDWENVSLSDHGTFIQIELPRTIVPNPGDFMDGSGDHLSKMAVFQITPDTGALRLFLNDDALLVKKAMKADILGDRVLVTIDHKALSSLIANDPARTAAPADAASADEVIASTSVDKDVPEPAAILQAASTEQSTVTDNAQSLGFGGGFDFQDKLTSITVFCGIMVLGMIMVMLAAPRIRKAKMAMAAAKGDVAMRSLASHNVAPKQKLELIDVAGQQILIGVTPGNISFLTAISPKETAVPRSQPHIQPNQIATQAHAQRQLVSKTPATRPIAVQRNQKGQIPSAYSKQKPQSNDTINDVTKLIREKLKNIPSV